MSDITEAVTRYAAATLYEAVGRRGALPDRIRPLWTDARIWGPASVAAGSASALRWTASRLSPAT